MPPKRSDSAVLEEPSVSVAAPGLAKEAEVKIPTPEVGMQVQYFLSGLLNDPPMAATVEIVGPAPGECTVSTSLQIGMKSGVVWAGDPEHPEGGPNKRSRNGCWRYIPGTAPNATQYDHYERRKQKLAERKAAREAAR